MKPYEKSECVWVVMPKPGTNVTLDFNIFDLEKSTNCEYDSLNVSNEVWVNEDCQIASIYAVELSSHVGAHGD